MKFSQSPAMRKILKARRPALLASAAVLSVAVVATPPRAPMSQIPSFGFTMKGLISNVGNRPETPAWRAKNAHKTWGNRGGAILATWKRTSKTL